jgi:PAS domain S-box-containing protein
VAKSDDRRGSESRGLLLPALVFLVLVVVAVVAGWIVFARQASDMRAESAHSLVAVRQLQSTDITSWFTDEVSDTRLLATTESLLTPLMRYMSGPRERVPVSLDAELELYRRGHGLAAVVVVDDELQPVVWTSARAEPAHDHPLTTGQKETATEAMRTGRVEFSGAYIEAGGAVAMDFSAPLRDPSAPGAPPIGALVIHTDAADSLFPLLEEWPPSLPTGESVLAAVHDGRFVAVNPLPVGGKAALTLSRPLSQTDLPAVQAVRGRRGIVEGVDYRAEPVLAAVGKVQGTPWYLVAKQDLAVIDKPIVERGWATIAWVVGFIILAGVLLLLYWRSREARTLRRLVGLERDRTRAEKVYAALMREAKEIVVVHRPDGVIVEANDWALRSYGYSRDEFVGRSMDLFASAGPAPAGGRTSSRRWGGGGHVTFDGVHRRRDGVEFPVEVGASTIQVDGEELVVAVIRDIGERRAAEAALRDSEMRYRTLFENTLSGFALVDVVLDDEGEPTDFVILAVNPAFETQTGLSADEVVGRRLSAVVPGVLETDVLERGGRVAFGAAPERAETFIPVLERRFDIQYASPRRGQFAAIIVDVTERREAEETLSGFFAGSLLGLFIVDRELRYVRVNATLAEMNHRSVEDHIGRPAAEVLAGFGDPLLSALRSVVDTGEPIHDLEVGGAIPGWPGGERHVLVSIFPIAGLDGEVRFVGGAVLDVTGARLAERELQRLKQRLEATVMASPLAIVAAGHHRKVQLWNPAAAAIFGWTADEVLGKELPIIPPDLRSQVEALEQRLMEGEQFAGLDMPCVRKDGERIHASISLALMRGQAGEPDSALMILEDVTERRANVVRLARLTRLYQVLSSVTEAIPEEREPGRLFETVCRVMVGQGGFRRAWVARRRRNGLVQVVASAGVDGPDDPSVEAGIVLADKLGNVSVALAEGRSDTTRDIATDPRTSVLAEEAAAAGIRSAAAVPIFIDGRHDTVLAISSSEPGRFDAEELGLLERLAADVGFAVQAGGEEAARRKAERRLEALNRNLERRVRERTDALEAANAELEAFSYSVSHDLRAPLRALDGFSLALAEDYGDRLDGQAEDYLARIRAASQRMAQLIDDLLMLSRVTRRDMTPREVDLSELARTIGDELSADDPDRRVTMTVAEDMVVTGDAQLLGVALRNLLGNAWKFTSRTQGAEVEVGMDLHDGERAYFVRDNGAGFDAKYGDKLFAPFQRLHGEDEFPGTGIGLATVQRIVRRHGGRVWAEGATGKGATVWFTLGPPGEGS